MKTFDILITDLKPEVQKEYIKFVGGEVNECLPIASVDIEEPEEPDEQTKENYCVCFAFHGYYTWEGKAKSKEEAEELAEQASWNVDCGELCDIDSQIVDIYINN